MLIELYLRKEKIMKQIERTKKPATKWAITRIKAETMKKVKANMPADRSISQEQFIDSLVIKGLG